MTAAQASDEFFSGRIGFDYLPGTLLRRRMVELASVDGDCRAWHVVYASRTGFGAAMPASGTVIAPGTLEVAGIGPTLLFCPRFRGLGRLCAPSRMLVADQEPEIGFIDAVLQRGWTVAIADGLGLGMSGLGPFQFLAGRAGAHAVLDLARAVRDLPELDAAEKPCAIWGFGDGGRAAIWAAETQREYAPDLDLRGVAAGAVIHDPAALVSELDGGPWAGLALAGLIGLSSAYRHLPVHHILTDAGQQVIERASTLDAASLQTEFRHQPLGQWCERPDPWNDAMWRYVLGNERSARKRPQVPVHIYHGTEDALVPIAMGRKLFSAYRALGVDLSWREYHTSHLGAAAEGSSEAISRLAAYLQRRQYPAQSAPPQTT